LQHVSSPPITDHVPPATVDKSGERIKRMFGGISGRYDFLNHLLSGGTDLYWRWRAVRTCPPRGDAPILDVCTGTGDLAFAYYRRTRGAVEIVGADFCPEMLAIGDKKKVKLGCGERVTFIEADSQNLPFEDGRFQLVTVAFGLRNVSDTDRGLREMTRVCRPGGRVAVLEFSMPSWQPFKAIYGFYFLKVLPRIGQWMMRNQQEAYSYLPESVGQFPSGEALAARMRNAGLCDVRFHPMTLGIATLYIGVKPTSDEARP
jgi:demethylmenaquinone methyltransferase/2-methoxy-6-polyprenyl-1,4-benzoquinol methylase